MKRLLLVAALFAAACQPLPSETGAAPPAETPGRVIDEVDRTDIPPPRRSSPARCPVPVRRRRRTR